MMKGNIVTVFGGTGFLGRRVIRHLLEREFLVRVASRHVDRFHMPDHTHLQSIRADIRDEQSVANAIADAHGVVNAVSLYVERGNDTFHAVHVQAARRVAAQAMRAGIERFLHVSGIGADVASRSLYIRKRGEGELAVRAEYPNAVLIRPAVMFGPDDTFLTTIITLLRRLPTFPMFDGGVTRLQPAYVEDVAEAVALVLQHPDIEAKTFDGADRWRRLLGETRASGCSSWSRKLRASLKRHGCRAGIPMRSSRFGKRSRRKPRSTSCNVTCLV
jgi:NADH dehydrogenase